MPISAAEAHVLIAAAHAHAETLDIRVTVAIVDEGGHLQALSRMEGAFALSSQIAESKAVGAVLWQRGRRIVGSTPVRAPRLLRGGRPVS